MASDSGIRWLPECSPEAIGEALRVVAPELSGLPFSMPDLTGKEDPPWQSACVALGEGFFMKFAWSRPAALRLAREIAVLDALAHEPPVPFLPEVVASTTAPLLLITRRVPGASLFDVIERVNPDRAGRQLASFLAALHQPTVLRRAVDAGVPAGPQVPPATTGMLRERLGKWARPAQWQAVARWCDWADEVLTRGGAAVLVHGDFHGDNQVWADGDLRLVVDFETTGTAQPEYDLRVLPGPGMGPGVELVTAVMRHYQQFTGRLLSPERVMAWHLRNALGDALWRSEAGIPLPDYRTPPEWIDDVAARFRAFGIDP